MKELLPFVNKYRVKKEEDYTEIRPEWSRIKKGDNLISPEEEKHLEDVAEEFKKWKEKEKRE